MIRKLLFLSLLLFTATAGLGAGYLWRSDAHSGAARSESDGQLSGASEYIRLNNQFIIPVLSGGRVSALVVLSLSLETSPGQAEQVYLREPKLRDAFLQVLFDHANTGGFNGSFTDSGNLLQLRKSLLGEAKLVLGEIVTGVLITEIARQDS